jgi:hypothetical protein
VNAAELRRLLTVVLPAGLAVAFVAVVVTAMLDDGTASAPSGEDPSATLAPAETVGAGGSPRVGDDHWHAAYQYIVCGVLHRPAPAWDGTGVHTHGDGIIHIHPFTRSEEGAGARLVKWFEYGGGILDEDEVRLPGESWTHQNGQECPDGAPGVVQVFVNGERLYDYMSYIPRDGDRITILFGPEEAFARILY